MIYNAVANVAQRVFASFDAVLFQPGKYDVPAVLNRIKTCKAYQDETAETAAKEIVKITVDTFTCSFRAEDAFSLLKQLGTAYQIPAACRATFTKKAETAPVAVSFRVFGGLKDLCSRVSKDTLHPCFNYICVDTKRRALIVCDQYTLSAVPVPEMYVSQDAKETYLITPAVLKAGKGICNIDTNGTATNADAVSAVDANIKYPNAARVLSAVPAEFITLGKKEFAQMKKHVAAAAKFGNNTPVILKADAGAKEIEIIGYKENAEDETAQETRRVFVSVPMAVPFSFTVAVAADRLGKVLAAEKMYLKDPNTAVCFVDETRRVFSVMYPSDLYKTPWKNDTFSVPVAADSANVADVAGTFAHVQDAPAVPFTDEETETAPDVPAAEDAANITYITKEYVPVIDEEIKHAVFVAAEYKYIPYKLNRYGVRVSRDHTADICAAELLLQRENLYIDNYALICGNGKTFAYISKHDEEISVNYDVQDEETANVETPAAAAAEDAPAVAVQDEETPAVFAKVDQYAVNDENGNAVIFETYAPQLGTDETETANVQDEETPAAADSVSAAAEDAPAVAVQDEETPAVFAKVDQYAVNDENGNAVIFETYAPQLGTDETETANVQDEETPAAADSVSAAAEDAPAVAADSVPAEDAQPQPWQSYFACMPETPAVADSVPADSVSVAAEDETPAVLIVCPADEETPAVAAADSPRRGNARRRFRLRPWLRNAAAVAVLIVCAVLIGWERETPAAADSVSVAVAADSLSFAADSPAVAVAADSFSRADSVSTFAADSVSVAADSLSLPAVADSLSFAAVPADSLSFAADSVSVAADSLSLPAVADSLSFAAVPADSLSFAADSVSVAADSLSLPVADSLPADSVSVAEDAPDVPAVQDEETPAAADSPAVAVPVAAEDAQPVAVADSPDVPAVADSVPADSVPAADSLSAPAVAAAGCPAVPAAVPYVIGCNIIHYSQAAPVIACPFLC